MNIIFDEKTKKALQNLTNGDGEKKVRVKVAAIGCGKPAYDLYVDVLYPEDIEVTIESINFIINKKDEKICNDIEIKYDKEVYNKDFYVRSL